MTEEQRKTASVFFQSVEQDDQTKVYPVDRSVKRKLTDRENELYTLLRKKGLTVAQIIDRCNPTAEEIIWMWNWDREELHVKNNNKL